MAGGSNDRNTRDGVPNEARGSVRGEMQTFLTTRQARINPEQAGPLADCEERRGVFGQHRNEVALLAGISSQYYTKLKRGNATAVSDSVIEGIARAPQLDEAERTHRIDLIPATGTTRVPRAAPQRVRSTEQRVLDSMIGTPALNARLDIVTANELEFALFSPIYAARVRPANNARFVRSTRTRPTSAGTGTKPPTTQSPNPGRGWPPPPLRPLRPRWGQSTRSDDFRRWAAHDFQIHSQKPRHLHRRARVARARRLTLLAGWVASTTRHSYASEHENT